MPKYLGQVVAIANDTIKNTQRALTDIHRVTEKPELLTGRHREYQPVEDGGERLPHESQRVQFTVREAVTSIRGMLAELLDAVAARDYTNSQPEAVADVRVNGEVLVAKAPMTYLLWLERQVKDLETFARKLPVHDPSTEWDLIDPRGIYQSTPVVTTRSVQEPRANVVVPATATHPAQVQGWNENVVKGTWTTHHLTGSIPVTDQAALIDRIHTLQQALHVAREEVNRTEVVDPKPGARVLEYLLG